MQMRKFYLRTLLLMVGVMVAGMLCSCTWYSQFTVGEKLKKLRVGMTKQAVLKVMGDPVKEKYSTPDVWFYFVDTKWHDGFTTRDECTPLVFKNGKLQGWGNNYYNEQFQLGKIRDL
jgi:outer membrane protein assembly factor BamE (lipoprotein component of BamABCDE complex)